VLGTLAHFFLLYAQVCAQVCAQVYAQVPLL
jgi:hypothetical protein